MSLLSTTPWTLAFLFACAIKATVLLTLTCFATAALRRKSAALRHHVWTAGILGSLILPLLALLPPVWHTTALGTASGLWTHAQAMAVQAALEGLPSMVVEASGSPWVSKLASFAVWVWGLGVLFIAVNLIGGLARLRGVSARSHSFPEEHRMRQLGQLSRSFRVVRPVRVIECANPAAMPLTWGVFKPQILLPVGAADWPEDRRRMVLSHELAHISRHDWLLQMLAELTRAFYWFHPLAWFAAAQLRQESERACDDAVLRSGIEASAYADELLFLARTLKRTKRGWSAALAVARPTNLERRFIAMLNPSLDRAPLSVRTKLLTAISACCVLFAITAVRTPAQDISGQFTGTIYDPSRAVVPNATVVVTNRKAGTIDMTTSDAEGKFQFRGLPAAEYEVKVLKPGFKAYVAPSVILQPGRDLSLDFTIELGSVSEELDVIAKNPSTSADSRNRAKPGRIRIGGIVKAPQLLTKVQPLYPPAAKAAGIEGRVILHAIIGIDGRPLSIVVRNSQIDPELARAAVEAVSQWRYRPTLLNGEPVEVDTTITVNFKLMA